MQVGGMCHAGRRPGADQEGADPYCVGCDNGRWACQYMTVCEVNAELRGDSTRGDDCIGDSATASTEGFLVAPSMPDLFGHDHAWGTRQRASREGVHALSSYA